MNLAAIGAYIALRRQTMRDTEVNVAYRWFLGCTMSQPPPHFATISYAFQHRFTAEVIEGVFRWVLEVEAAPGNIHDSAAFGTVFERLLSTIRRLMSSPPTQAANV